MKHYVVMFVFAILAASCALPEKGRQAERLEMLAAENQILKELR
jgi:hypothetical protein